MFTNLGRALGLLRELRGIAQARLAREAGIGKSQLSKYENGKELPKLDSLEKVLSALSVSYLEFFYTLHQIDEMARSLGEIPKYPFSLSSDAAGILDRSTKEGFRRVLDEYFALYGHVMQQHIRQGQEAPRNSGHHLDARKSKDNPKTA